MNKFVQKISISTICFFCLFSFLCVTSPKTTLATSKKTFSQSFKFKDSALDSAIKKTLQSSKKQITKKNLSTIKSINLSSSKIHDLNGIEALVNLRQISLDGYNINSIKPLKSLKHLNKIIISNVSCTSYDSAELTLKKSKKLITINNKDIDKAIRDCLYSQEYKFNYNRLTQLDVEKIEELDLTGYNIKNLSGIKCLTNLKTIRLNDNVLYDLTPLYSLKKLNNVYYLDCYTLKECEAAIKVLKSFTGFKDKEIEKEIKRTLKIENRDLSALDLLKLKELTLAPDFYEGSESLSTDVYKIKNIDDLRYCINLETLWIWGTQVSDISPLKDLKKLETLNIKYNYITDYSLLKEMNIKNLYATISSDKELEIISLMPKLQTFNDTTVKAYKDAMNICKDAVAKLIKPGMTDYEKYVLVHDYITENTFYNIESLKGNKFDPDSQNLTSVYSKKLSVCAGYSEALSYMLQLCGIKSKIVAGSLYSKSGRNIIGLGHIWDLVMIDDKWYYADSTTDDWFYIKDNTSNNPCHNFLMVSADQLSQTQYWRRDLFPKAEEESELFRNFYEGDSCYVDGCYYALSGTAITSQHPYLDDRAELINGHFKHVLYSSGYLYFINIDKANSLYRIKINGGTSEKVVSQNVKTFYTYKDSIYFIDNENNNLYKLSIDNNTLTKISSDKIDMLSTYKNFIFYKSLTDNKFYRIDLNGENRIKVTDDVIKDPYTYGNPVNEYSILDDTIYYINSSDNNKLYKMNLDGTNKIKLSDANCKNLEVIKGFIYYVNTSDNGHYRIKMDNLENVKIGTWKE